VAREFLLGSRDGAITNRSGDSYKPCVVRSYEQSLRLHVLLVYGEIRDAGIKGRPLWQPLSTGVGPPQGRTACDRILSPRD
jgi:hypothetical protein